MRAVFAQRLSRTNDLMYLFEFSTAIMQAFHKLSMSGSYHASTGN